MAFVAQPKEYKTMDGETVTQDSIDLVSRMMSMQKAHPSYAMTGAMCTAAAAVVPDSIVNQVCSEHMDTQYIRIGHPGGILECGVDFQQHNKIPEIKDTFGFRTANPFYWCCICARNIWRHVGKRDCGRIQQFHVCDFGGCYVPVWYGIQ